MRFPDFGSFQPHKLSYKQCLSQVDQEITQIVATAPIPLPTDRKTEPKGWSFLVYGTKFLFQDGKLDLSYFNDCCVEGYDDQSLDTISLYTAGTTLFVYLTQYKHAASFSDVELREFDTALQYLFDQQKVAYSELKNARLVAAIDKIRQLRKTCSSTEVHVLYITRAQSHGKTIPDMVQREKRRIEAKWSSKFAEFSVRLIGPQDLVACQLAASYRVPSTKLHLPIFQDKDHSATVLRYAAPDLDQPAIVFTVTANALAKLTRDNEDWIFNENVRVFLDVPSHSVNERVYESCTQNETAALFWLLNNGITITCQSYEHKEDPDDPEVVLMRPQIVNGCQTSMTLKKALDDSSLKPDTRLLVRVLATQQSLLVDRITFATNNQNAVKVRDLRSNDATQRMLRLSTRNIGWYYETKKNEYKALSRQDRRRIAPNDRCGQACLAVILKDPATAMSQLSSIWGDMYEKIFTATPEQLIHSFVICRYCNEQCTVARKSTSLSAEEAKVSVDGAISRYGRFHLARIMSFLLTDDRSDKADFVALIAAISSDHYVIKFAYRVAREILMDVLTSHVPKISTGANNYFNILRTKEINAATDKMLHQQGNRLRRGLHDMVIKILSEAI